MTSKVEKNLTPLHISVLLRELVDTIRVFPERKNIIVDATLWMGGHAREVLKKLKKWDIFIWFDADLRNLEIIKPQLQKEFATSGIQLFFVNDNFQNLAKNLKALQIPYITGIYYDLGISSLHVDDASRGFSFKKDGPLDMRYDVSRGFPASHIIHSYSEKELLKVLKEYGEDPNARKITKAILDQRKLWKRFLTTQAFADFLDSVTKFPKTKTRIFQALRIETNNELWVIEDSLAQAISFLETDGVIFVISFHSLEDRIIKNFFRDESRDCICHDVICTCKHKRSLQIMTKKPIVPTQEEIAHNPRSRSAKARYAIKM